MPVQEVNGPGVQPTISEQQKQLILNAIDSVTESISNLSLRIVHLQEKTSQEEKIHKTNVHKLSLVERSIVEIQSEQTLMNKTVESQSNSLEKLDDDIRRCKEDFADTKEKCEELISDMKKIRQDRIRTQIDDSNVIKTSNDSLKKTPNPYKSKLKNTHASSEVTNHPMLPEDLKSNLLSESNKSVESPNEMGESEEEAFLSLSLLSVNLLETTTHEKHTSKLFPGEKILAKSIEDHALISKKVMEVDEKIIPETLDILDDKSKALPSNPSISLLTECSGLREHYKQFQDRIAILISKLNPKSFGQEIKKLSQMSVVANAWDERLSKLSEKIQQLANKKNQKELIPNPLIKQANVSLKNYEKRFEELEKLSKNASIDENALSKDNTILKGLKGFIYRIKHFLIKIMHKLNFFHLFSKRDLSSYKVTQFKNG